jgi:CubicO group peptidase (beta-lactamase class C family)
VTWHFYALGPTGIWSTPADLVRWADNCRTGNVGGSALLTPAYDGAPETEHESSRNGAGIRYGAGIFILADNTLAHNGSFEGFRSMFSVSPDRQSAVAVLCNRVESKPDILSEGLTFIWGFR